MPKGIGHRYGGPALLGFLRKKGGAGREHADDAKLGE